ncbi:MAG: MBOAT family protein [Oscillospiraceae bacterium]|nr:MBOAT family protein [Oscillospiraceae bacterium]
MLLASYYFYISWNFDLLYLILLTTAISYASALIIEKVSSPGIKRLALVVTLVSCLGILFFFKYFNFLSLAFFQAANFFGAGASEFTLNVVLPVGISFYTFQTLSYVIDVYRGTMKAERHFGYYALFVSFFPQLVAGPIERPENLLPQFKARNRPDPADFSEGLRIALRGFIKKIVVADLSAQFVNKVYNDPAGANGPLVVVATLLFAFQIYCDFSGYTDIATGCARMMGIKLMKNFDQPYSSKTIKEFWARWHISLSSWFRDYLYIPLGGNRCSAPRYLTNIFIVFLVSGLWHGADWTFVIWGALHGFYQITGHMTKNIREKACTRLKIDPKSKIAAIWKNACTFVLVCFAWIFFRANNVSDLGVLLNRLFFSWSGGFGRIFDSFGEIGYKTAQIAITVFSVYIINVLDASPRALSGPQSGELDFFSVSKYVLAVWVIAFAWLILLTGNGASAFIYFQF